MIRLKTALLVWILSCLALPAFSQIDKSNYALLWEISGNGLKKSSYLFGTMHLRDDRVFEFPDSLLLTLDQCEAFANETRLDSTICNLLQMYEFGDTTNFLKNYLPEYTYKKVNKALFEKTGFYIEMLDIKEPQRIETILSDHDFEYYRDDRDAELDYYLFQRAYEQGKPLYGLEQETDYKKLSLSYFDEFEYNYQPLGDTTGKKEFMDNLLDHYRSGNLDSIGKFAVSETFVSNYDYQFINGRNKEMVQSMIPLMQKHSVFVAIGAAHLPGEEGVIQLLKKEGFILRKVESKFSNLPISKPENQVSPEWMLTDNKKEGYQFATPGKPFKVVPAKASEKIIQEAFYYFDIPTQTTFSARTRLYPYINSGISKEEAMMTEARRWAFKRAISKDPAEMNLKLKDFYSGSLTGKETLIEIDENTVNRMVIFLEKNTLFMFVAEGSRENVFNEKANRFFESIVIQPAKETNWQTFTSKAGGFSIDMPEEPSEEILEIPYDIGANLNIRAKVFLSKDLEKGDTYMVRYLDYPVGIGIVEDSSFYQSQVDEILARYQLPETKPEIVYLSGIKFLKLDILLNQLRLVFWVGYQGNRSYLLMVVPSIGPESKIEDYNNWVQTLKIEPLKLAPLTTVKLEKIGLEIPLPNEAVLMDEEVNIFSYPIESAVSYGSLDTTSSISFYITGASFGKYTWMPDLDSMKRSIANVDASEYEIAYSRDTTFHGFPTIKSLFIYPGTGNASLSELVFTGKGYVEILINIPERMLDDGSLDPFYKGIQFDLNKFDSSIYLPKGDIWLDDLMSDNDSLVMYAKQTEDIIVLKEENLPKIYNALSARVENDTNYYRTKKQILFEKLETLQDVSTLAYLESLYPDLPPQEQIFLLSTLTWMEDIRALPIFFRLANSFPKEAVEVENLYTVFRPFRDKPEKVTSYVYDMVELWEHPVFQEEISQVLYQASLQEDTDPGFLKKHEKKFIKKAAALSNEVDWNFDKEVEYPFNYNTLYAILGLMGQFEKTDLVLSTLNEIETKANPETKAIILLSKIQLGETISKDEWEGVHQDTVEWIYLLKSLQAENHLELVPKKYKKQEKFLLYYLSYFGTIEDGTTYSDIRILKKEEKDFEGQELNIYLFILTADNYGVEEQYFGIISQPKDKKSINAGPELIHFMGRDPETPIDVNKQFEILWEDFLMNGY